MDYEVSHWNGSQIIFLRGNNAYCTVLSVDYGVPQGCMVGLILFIMFISDIIISSSGTQIVIYADDTSAFIFLIITYAV